jgi:hypothetical protein
VLASIFLERVPHNQRRRGARTMSIFDTVLLHDISIAGLLPEGKRNLAFGLFYAGYGVGWLAGSVATGLLYRSSRLGLIAFAVIVQLASLPVFVIAHRLGRQRVIAPGSR